MEGQPFPSPSASHGSRTDSGPDSAKGARPGGASIAGGATSVRSTGPGGLRNELRLAVEDLHLRLDRQVQALDFGQARDYRLFLVASASVVPAFEGALERGGVERLLPDWPERSRRHALRRDLVALGAPWPAAADGPERIADRAGQLGAGYALEGSRNGAAMMLRAVQAGDPALGPATAFLGHGRHLPLWRRFVERLEGEALTGRQVRRAVDTARSVFEAYLLALAPAGTRAG